MAATLPCLTDTNPIRPHSRAMPTACSNGILVGATLYVLARPQAIDIALDKKKPMYAGILVGNSCISARMGSVEYMMLTFNPCGRIWNGHVDSGIKQTI